MELISDYSIIAEHKVNIYKSIAFLHIAINNWNLK